MSNTRLRLHSGRGLVLLLIAAFSLACGQAAWAAGIDAEPAEDSGATAQPAPPPPAQAASPQEGAGDSSLKSDIKRYFTAPLHWEGRDWAWFGGALAAIGAAHHYDTQVRTHFIKEISPTASTSSKDKEDIIPTVAVFGLTWAYAGLSDDNAGRRETWAMAEAAGLSTVTVFALKYAAGRERPDETSDPNKWRESGKSFPSAHATAAFAVGTVLAESGNDEFRWVRRLLGYGLGAATSYQRLKHNAHWLSDVVAGAALGTASAHFAMNSQDRSGAEPRLALVPIPGGAMLTYHMNLP